MGVVTHPHARRRSNAWIRVTQLRRVNACNRFSVAPFYLCQRWLSELAENRGLGLSVFTFAPSLLGRLGGLSYYLLRAGSCGIHRAAASALSSGRVLKAMAAPGSALWTALATPPNNPRPL